MLSDFNVSTIISDTIKRALFLSSAGTTYQGECSVLVSLKHSSYACLYSFQYLRSCISAALNFQFFSTLSIRSIKRFFCSSLDKCKKNLIIQVPLWFRCFSISTIELKRCFQIVSLLSASLGKRCACKISG